jgi:hypothetical protein
MHEAALARSRPRVVHPPGPQLEFALNGGELRSLDELPASVGGKLRRQKIGNHVAVGRNAASDRHGDGDGRSSLLGGRKRPR